MTLIAVYNSSGCIGRCDAKCYEAQLPECECVCGGVNHGAGLAKAMDNTRELAEEWVKEYGRKTGQTVERYEISPLQLPLF